MTHLKAGDKAPDFQGVNQDGHPVALADYQGKKLVLFFYPQDNTPTCTVEACNLRDHYQELRDHGFSVLGVSPDSARKHTNFIKKFELPYDLLADTERQAIEAYGVWGPKKFMGREFDGLHRTTFVINENGVIEQVIQKVKAKMHAAQILEQVGA
ncbi:MAG: thioredoxin-dependent thiol peroxidase [Bacteroidota bacterium]